MLDEDFNPILSDFGLSQPVPFVLTPLNEAPFYQAPEALTGETITEKSDIYSWAIIVNSILTENLPWQENNSQKIPLFTFLKMVITEKKRPKLIQGEEYNIYKDLIERGWKEEPNERPTSQEIIETLMKEDALLPSVEPEKMKKYQQNVILFLENDTQFSITLFGKLESDILNLQKKNQEMEEQMNKIKKQLEEKHLLLNEMKKQLEGKSQEDKNNQ